MGAGWRYVPAAAGQSEFERDSQVPVFLAEALQSTVTARKAFVDSLKVGTRPASQGDCLLLMIPG